MRSYNTWKRKRKYKGDALSQFRADTSKMVNRIIQNKGSMRKKLLCLCTAVLLDLCFLGIVCRLAVGMQWEDLAEVEQADQTDQTVSSPECFSGGELALTFDDGPHRVYTKKLLDGLRERGVKASFFLVGENIPGNEELVQQMAKDGHLIGVHCMAHVDLARQPIEKSVEEIRETADWIEAVTGKRPE